MVGVVGVVGHLQIDLPVFPGLAAVKQAGVLLIQRRDVLHRRRVQDHDVHAVAQRRELLFLDGLHTVLAQVRGHIADVGHAERGVALGSHQMVRGAPVAQPADVHAGPVLVRHTGSAAGELRSLAVDEGDELLCPLLPSEQLTQQLQGGPEGIVKYAVGAGAGGDDRYAHLLLQGVGLLHVLVLGDDDVWLAGEDLLRLRRLGVGAAHAAGGQLGEHVAVGHHVGPRHVVKHLGPLRERGVVNVLHAAQQRHIAHVAVHPQGPCADAHHTLIAVGDDSDLAADHIGDGNGAVCALIRLRVGRGVRRLAAAAHEAQRHHHGQQQRGPSFSVHMGSSLSHLQ